MIILLFSERLPDRLMVGQQPLELCILVRIQVRQQSMTIKGTDKISDFPGHFNQLEEEVKSLSENTRGIKWATWVTAISTAVLAFLTLGLLIVGFLTFLKLK